MNRPGQARRAIRLVAWTSVLAAALFAVSCRDVVTDDVTDAEAALCDTFDACAIEGNPCGRLESYFAVEGELTLQKYLEYYQTWECGKGCGSVEICLDFDPLCGKTNAACEASFECCEASSGAASCEGGRCCYDVGVVCKGPEDCCPLTDGTPIGCFARQDGAPKTCGGADACALREEACEATDDCCGDAVCTGGFCTVKICVDRGAPCEDREGCCTYDDECKGGVCKPLESCDGETDGENCCAEINEPCASDGGLPCCGGRDCIQTLTGDFLCGE